MVEWLELMEGVIIPYIVSKGVVVNASFCVEDDDTKYIWIRRFRDEADLNQKYKDVYESDHWVEHIKPRIGELLIREEAVINRMLPTEMSPMQ